MQTTQKPTRAQLERLKQIGRGHISRSGPSWVRGFYHVTGTATGGVTYVMMCNLQEAGWITDELDQATGYYKVILTESGLKATQEPNHGS